MLLMNTNTQAVLPYQAAHSDLIYSIHNQPIELSVSKNAAYSYPYIRH